MTIYGGVAADRDSVRVRKNLNRTAVDLIRASTSFFRLREGRRGSPGQARRGRVGGLGNRQMETQQWKHVRRRRLNAGGAREAAISVRVVGQFEICRQVARLTP